jgi:hypothetical protein
MWLVAHLGLCHVVPLTRPLSRLTTRGYQTLSRTMIPPHQRIRRSSTICFDTGTSPYGQINPHLSSTFSAEPKPYYQHLTNTGSEPGVDVTRDAADYAHLKTQTRVTVRERVTCVHSRVLAESRGLVLLQVVDYNSDGEGFRVDLPGDQLEAWLKGDDGQRPSVGGMEDKTPGRSVRWINVDGGCLFHTVSNPRRIDR